MWWGPPDLLAELLVISCGWSDLFAAAVRFMDLSMYRDDFMDLVRNNFEEDQVYLDQVARRRNLVPEAQPAPPVPPPASHPPRSPTPALCADDGFDWGSIDEDIRSDSVQVDEDRSTDAWDAEYSAIFPDLFDVVAPLSADPVPPAAGQSFVTPVRPPRPAGLSLSPADAHPGPGPATFNPKALALPFSPSLPGGGVPGAVTLSGEKPCVTTLKPHLRIDGTTPGLVLALGSAPTSGGEVLQKES